jgi:hypothetical protein
MGCHGSYHLQAKVKDLVVYTVSRLNIRRTTSLSENVSPRVLFTGVKIDHKKELNLSFGDYVEAYEGTDNTSTARSSTCIALYPNCNSTGSWTLWKLDTNSYVQRSRFVRMVTTDRIIDRVNGLAEEELRTGEVELNP